MIATIYKRCRNLPQSTRKLLDRATNEKIGEFPNELAAAFVKAVWYNEIRMIRDELTHSDTGSYRQAQDEKISYTHICIKRGDSILIIPDVFAKLDELSMT